MKIHTFKTEEEAQQSLDMINQGEGIPAFPDSTTQTYCRIYQREGMFFILEDDVTKKYIKDSVEYVPDSI